MPVADWSVSASLESVYGTLALNASSGDRYLLLKDGSDMWQDVRAQQVNIPQGDGGLIQERFDTGTRLRLLVSLWDGDDPACDAALMRMVDTLSKHAHSMLKAAMSGRFAWDPDGTGGSQGTRILDYVQMASRMEWDWSNPDVRATLNFDSPFPYAIDLTQTTTSIAAGGSGVLNNTGNTPMYPVFKVNGATSAFTLSNDTTGFAIVYSGTAIGGGSYAEIDTFRNTVYLNGDGANLKDSIDVAASDFFSLVPGNNVISITGASVDVLWQAAWV